jgi:hypothetical protein
MSQYRAYFVPGAVDPWGLSKITIIIKGCKGIQKVYNVSHELAVKLLKSRVKDAKRRPCDRKYSGKVFVNLDSDKAAKDLAEKVGGRKPVWHSANDKGHPGHYHPPKGTRPSGKPDTEGTPHIGSDYGGNPSIPILTLPALEEVIVEGVDIAIDFTPIIGDLRDAPELAKEVQGLMNDLADIGEQSASITCQIRKNKCQDVLKDKCGEPMSAGSLSPGLPSWWPF